MLTFDVISPAPGADMVRRVLVAIALLQPAAVVAQDSAGPAPPPAGAGSPASIHIHNYGAFDLKCLRWTDGCRTCSRGEASETTCSNIGIACQPTEVKCIAQKQEPQQK